jgi:hypothetical protein
MRFQIIGEGESDEREGCLQEKNGSRIGGGASQIEDAESFNSKP